MKLDFSTVLTDAWALFRRDRDLLLRIAAPFLFLPAFALALVVPDPPMPDPAAGNSEAQALVWADQVTSWASTNGGWYGLAYAISFFGTSLLYALYLDRREGELDVGTAMTRSGALFPRYLLAMVLVSLPAGAGLLLYAIPGLYILGRTMLTGPALFAEAPVGALAAIRRSLTLTRGSGLPLMGLAAFSYIGGWLIGEPFMMVDRWMRTNAQENPVVLAIVDAGAAAAAMAAGLAMALIAISAYRRLAR
ncbi:hypothetical protein U1701_14885 [Sphingomonas sp. PB2P19]|uniref:hypothetical protein n=1 Tax=Sphingomonas rhamnosi TaxID=3096156 RepID=UPI002FC740E9